MLYNMKGNFPGHEVESVFKSWKRFNHKPVKAAYNTLNYLFQTAIPKWTAAFVFVILYSVCWLQPLCLYACSMPLLSYDTHCSTTKPKSSLCNHIPSLKLPQNPKLWELESSSSILWPKVRTRKNSYQNPLWTTLPLLSCSFYNDHVPFRCMQAINLGNINTTKGFYVNM